MIRINRWQTKVRFVIFCSALSISVTGRQAFGQHLTGEEVANRAAIQADQAIQDLIDKTLSKHDFPGLVAVIAKQDQPIRIAASGKRKSNQDEPITIDDQIHIGSCTKAMTASMLARLVDRKVLSWDTSIKQALPELSKKIHPDYHDVTFSQLTMHYGGMPPNARNWWLDGGDDITQRRELIAADSLAAAPKHKPGSQYLYSNLGYMMAGLMAARTAGKSWEQLVREEVFEPLDLKSAGFGPPGTKGDIDQPWGHVIVNGKFVPMQRDNAPALGPAGTIHLSLSDWATFCLQHATTEGNPFLSAAAIKELHKPDPKSRYAKGWIVVNRSGQGTMLTHSGSNTMWLATVWIAVDSKTVYLAATNVAGDGVAEAIDGVISGLMQMDR